VLRNQYFPNHIDMNTLSDQQKDAIAIDAKEFIKKNEKLLIETFADPKLYPPRKNPFSIFMAGSPGAGKTEFSRGLIDSVENPLYAVRIDADEIKGLIPQYTGKNSDIIQGAASLGVEKLYDNALHNNQNVIVDGTLQNYDKAFSNIKRSIDKKRFVVIFYLYQDPLIAWGFTKKREKLEGRHIPKEAFINAFFAAKENVNKLKSEFKEKVVVFLIKKTDINNNKESVRINIDNIDNYIKEKYTKNSLNSKL